MANPFVHIELSTHDLAKAKEFYARLFDWKLEEIPQFNYTMIGVGEGVGGGMMTSPNPSVPSHWLPFVSVDDINAATEKARGLGANVVRGPMEVPGAGWFTIFIDPTGATLGLWQSTSQSG
jgi:predicted enzyme related to lactoylglutathione lyase